MKNKKGFTLIELMLVVIIIGALVAMVMPRLAGRSEQAKVAAAQADISANIATALKLYELDNSKYPDQKNAKIIATLSADKNSIDIEANSFDNRFALMRFCYGGGSIVGVYIKNQTAGWNS